MSSRSMRNISKILIAFSFFLFAVASYLSLEKKYSVEGLEIVSEETKTETVNIDAPNNDNTTTEVVENGNNNPTTTNNPNTSNSNPNTNKSNTTKNTNTKKPTNNANNKNITPPVTDSNDSLRDSIERRYNISIKYGSETDGYTVGGMSVKSITNISQITKALKNLNTCLATYPSGLYGEVTSNFPLTIYLINKYSINNVTGVTDSTNRNVKMSIATAYPFNDSFHHETYHYLELYMRNRGMSYASWNDLNPSTFRYGTVNANLSYARTFSADSYFVNDYAQSSQEEDRASTFEFMMASSKASCLNNGKPIYKKAKYMADTMDFFIDSCSTNTTERWEKFL